MPNPNFTTLEEAQAEIIRLNEVLAEVTNERDTLSQNNTNLAGELESVRKLNQQYFNKLSAQYSQEPDETNNDEQVPSCEDFAKTLNIF
jgi:chromosome segregation ATPase